MLKSSEVEKFPLDQIVVDDNLQARVAINPQTVDAYCESAADGPWPFPPIRLMVVDDNPTLIDGRHRVEVAKRLGMTEIPAIVSEGSWSDAIKAACACNAEHGLPRTNKDKRRAIELALVEFPNLSNREISKICKVSHTSVNTVRSDLDSKDQLAECWLDATGPYHPTAWQLQTGDACYLMTHADGSNRLMMIFQANRLSWGEGDGADRKWTTEIYQSNISGLYSVAIEDRQDDGQVSFDIMRPATPEGVTAIVDRMMKRGNVEALAFTNDSCFCEDLVMLVGVPGQAAYDRQHAKIKAMLSK